jgi:hypothetical protein
MSEITHVTFDVSQMLANPRRRKKAGRLNRRKAKPHDLGTKLSQPEA